jgi:hypothetical protein
MKKERMKNISYSTHLMYGAAIAALATYSAYQYYQLKQKNRQIKEIELDKRAGQIFLYKMFFANQADTLTLPSQTQVPMSQEAYQKFQISTKWDTDLSKFLYEKALDLTNHKTILILNISSLGKNAIMLADRLKRQRSKKKIIYLDINPASIQFMNKNFTHDYPNLTAKLVDYEYFKSHHALDPHTLEIIKNVDYVIVQGPWSHLQTTNNRVENQYHLTPVASFFSTPTYQQFKVAFMQACLSQGHSVVETTHSFIAKRTLSEEKLKNCQTSAFIPVAHSKYMEKKRDDQNGVFIHTPKL